MIGTGPGQGHMCRLIEDIKKYEHDHVFKCPTSSPDEKNRPTRRPTSGPVHKKTGAQVRWAQELHSRRVAGQFARDL